jgi:hypothetical protein
MERLYVRSKIDSAGTISNLEQECNESQEKIKSLERLLAAYQKEGVSFDSSGDTAPNSFFSVAETVPDVTLASSDSSGVKPSSSIRHKLEFFNKRFEILEAANFKHSQITKTLKAELETARALSKKLAEKGEQEMTSLRLENGALINKISALEIEMGLSTGNIDGTIRSRRYKMLEKNLDDYIVEIMRFEDQLRMKDRIISRLSSLAVEKRLDISLERSPERELQSKPCPKSPNSPMSWIEDDQRTKATADETETSSVSELQSQLTDIQEQLNQKDETLNYVRAKYSARVAKLKLKADSRLRKDAMTGADLYFI